MPHYIAVEIISFPVQRLKIQLRKKISSFNQRSERKEQILYFLIFKYNFLL